MERQKEKTKPFETVKSLKQKCFTGIIVLMTMLLSKIFILELN